MRVILAVLFAALASVAALAEDAPLTALRTGDDTPVREAILHTMGIKPAGHEFTVGDGARRKDAAAPKIMRFMSLTGG